MSVHSGSGVTKGQLGSTCPHLSHLPCSTPLFVCRLQLALEPAVHGTLAVCFIFEDQGLKSAESREAAP